jgi:hypothetical protein
MRYFLSKSNNKKEYRKRSKANKTFFRLLRKKDPTSFLPYKINELLTKSRLQCYEGMDSKKK